MLFRPAKGPPAIAHVVFTGTGEIPAGILQTAMYGVAIGVPYSEPRVRLLLDNTIRPIYEAHGLMRVAFPKIETAPAKDVDGTTVTIQVTPGPPYKLERRELRGRRLFAVGVEESGQAQDQSDRELRRSESRAGKNPQRTCGARGIWTPRRK